MGKAEDIVQLVCPLDDINLVKNGYKYLQTLARPLLS